MRSPLRFATPQPGYTVIELLLCMAIVGILAAIMLVTVGRTREHAYVGAMQNDLHNFALAQEVYFDRGDGYAPSPSALTAFSHSDDVSPLAFAYDSTSWTYIVRHNRSDMVCSLSAGTRGTNQIESQGKIFCSKDQPLAFSVSTTVPSPTQPVQFDASAFFNTVAVARADAPAGMLARLGHALDIPALYADETHPAGWWTIALVAWDFGDGTVVVGGPSAISAVSHAYTGAGPYRVRAVAVLRSGVIFSGTRTIGTPNTLGPDAPASTVAAPFANLRYTAPVVHVGDTVAFDGRGSAPSARDTIVSYNWDFGDGAVAQGSTAGHVFSQPGFMVASLGVIGAQGGVGVAAQMIPVLPAVGTPGATASTLAPPVAEFRFSPAAPAVGDTVLFQATTGTNIASYGWDFADFTTAEGGVVAHPFNAPALYRVLLTVTGVNGQTDRSAQAVTVAPLNRAPVARLSLSATTVLTGGAIVADGSASFDPDTATTADSVVSYLWDFGDGTSRIGRQAAHQWSVAGQYAVTLRVADTHGATGTAQGSVTVRTNQPPVPVVAISGDRLVGASLAFDARGTTDADDALASVRWAFGDGSTGSGTTASHVYSVPGTYQVVMTATDSLGASAQWSAPLSVGINQPPVAAWTSTPSVLSPGDSAVLDASASHDPDNAIASYSWSSPDFALQAGVRTTARSLAEGRHTVVLTVTDALGASGTASGDLLVIAPPTARLTATPAQSVTGRPVMLDGHASTAGEGAAIASYSLEYGNGQGAAGATGAVAYATAGTYTARLVVTDADGRTGSASVLVPVAQNVPPTARFLVTPAHATIGSTIGADASASSDTDGHIVSYAWSTGSSTVTTQLVLGAGPVDLQLTVTDDAGASGQAHQVVTPNQRPLARVLVDGSASDTVRTVRGHVLALDGSASTDSDGSIVGYSWSFTDGSGAQAGVTARHLVPAVGTSTLTLTVTDNWGAEGRRDVVVVAAANQPPTVDFQWTPAIPLPDSLTQFASQAADADGVVTAYAWDFGDFSASSLQSPAHRYPSSGGYSVTLRVTDDAGASALATHLVLVNQPPVALFTVNGHDPRVDTVTVTTGHRSLFNGTVSTDQDGGISAYSWSFGDGSLSVEPTPVHAYTDAGRYLVTLQVTDNHGAQGYTEGTVSVTTNQLPTASFTWSPATPLPGQTVTFTSFASDADGTIQSYDWDDFTDATPTPVATHVFSGPGSFTVRLTVMDDSWATVTVTQTVLVVGPPAPAISVNNGPIGTMPVNVVAGRLVHVDGSSSTPQDGTIAGYAWSWGDAGADSLGVQSAHRYAHAGTDTMRLTVTDVRGGVGMAVREMRVAVNQPPVAHITTPTLTPIVGSSLVLDGSLSSDADGAIVSYAWSEAGAVLGSASSLSLSIGAPGIRTISLVVTDDAGATGAAEAQITPNAPPVARLVATPAAPVVGQAVALDGSASTDDGTIVSYRWTADTTVAFATSTLAPGVRSSVRPSVAGPMVVSLQVTDNQGAATVSRLVVPVGVNTAPRSAFTFTPLTPVIGSPVTFQSTATDAEGNITAYAWDFGDFGASAASETAAHSFTAQGSYSVRLTVTDAGGLSGVATQSVLVDLPPQASFTVSPTAPVVGSPVQFQSTSRDMDGSVAGYAWAFGDNATATVAAPQHSYAAVGTYTATLVVTDNLGIQSTPATAAVTVRRPPTAALALPALVNPGDVVTMDAAATMPGTAPITAYLWTYSDGGHDSTVVNHATHSFATAGLYAVTLRVVDAAGLSSSASASITVDAAPQAVVSAPSVVVKGAATTFTSVSTDPDAGQAATLACLWSWGDGSATSSLCQTSHVFTSQGTGVVLRVTDSFGRTSTVTQAVTVAQAPAGGMLFHLRTDMGLTLSGTTVTTWRSYEGSVVNYTTTASAGSTVRTGANGTSSVSLTATGGITLPYDSQFGSTGGTVAMYVGIPADRLSGYITGRGHGRNDQNDLYWNSDTKSSVLRSGATATGTSITRGTTGCLISRFGNGSFDIGSGSALPTPSTYPTYHAPVRQQNNQGDVINGTQGGSTLDVYEVIWYDHPLVDAERTALAQYFAARYGGCR